MKKSELIFDTIFRQKRGFLKFTLEAYKKLYRLKDIENTFSVSPEEFVHIQQTNSFCVLCIYNEKKKIYLHHALDGNTFSLPGGSIHDTDDIYTAVRRVGAKVHPELCLGEIEPIALVTNVFSCNGKFHTHRGIAFVARVRNYSHIKSSFHSGSFFSGTGDTIGRIHTYANKEICELAIARIQFLGTTFPEQEIATNEKYAVRYFIHNQLIKKLFLTPKIKKKQFFTDLLMSKMSKARSLIDVSCGDNTLIHTLKRKLPQLELAVANDISRSQIDLTQTTSSPILFTNHNALYLPFKDSAFDIAYCGNTLHHMRNREDLCLLLDCLFRISSKIIFVEIEDPKITGGIPYYLHKYWYSGFLKDAGGAYLSEQDFKTILTEAFVDKAKIQFSTFRNVQGKYLIAEIEKIADKPQRHLEFKDYIKRYKYLQLVQEQKHAHSFIS